MARYIDDAVYDTLKKALNAKYTVAPLKDLAKLVCDYVPGIKGDIIDAIARAMQGDKLEVLFNQLDQIEQYGVAEAVFAPGGELDFRKFKAKYPQRPKIGRSYRYERESRLFDLFIIYGRIPTDIRDRLKTFVPRPEADNMNYVDTPPGSIPSEIQDEPDMPLEIRSTARSALSNLEAVLRLIDGGKLKVSQKTGRPTAAAVKKISKLLHGGDWYHEVEELEEVGPILSFAWPMIVQGAGLAKAHGSALKLTNSGKKALTGSLPEVIKKAWERWEKTRILDEFSRVDHIKGQKTSRGRTLTVPSKRRPIINEALGHCMPGKWVGVDELMRFMRSKGLEFEVARYEWKLYICESGYGNLEGYGGGSIIEGRYLLAYLFEYAGVMGLIDVAYTHPAWARSDYDDLWGADDLEYLSRYDGLRYIRLNSLGAYALGAADGYTPPVEKRRPVLKVLPNHDVVVTDAVSLTPADRMFLNKTCKKVSSSLWRISPGTVLDAVQGGASVKQIMEFLESRSSEAIPKTVTTLIEEAKKRSTRLSYPGRAHLIRSKDPVLVTLISSDRKLSKMCLPAGDDHIVVLPGKEKPFIKALANIGYIVPKFKEQI